jgi:hypothetical protein
MRGLQAEHAQRGRSAHAMVARWSVSLVRGYGQWAMEWWEYTTAPPRLVCLPSTDTSFADAVQTIVATNPGMDAPAELERALRPYFASIRVREREVSGANSLPLDTSTGTGATLRPWASTEVARADNTRG